MAAVAAPVEMVNKETADYVSESVPFKHVTKVVRRENEETSVNNNNTTSIKEGDVKIAHLEKLLQNKESEVQFSVGLVVRLVARAGT